MLIIWPNHLQYLSTHAIILAASSLLAFEKNKMSSAYIMWVMAGPPLLALIPLMLLEAGAELSVQPGGPRPLQKVYKIVYGRLKTKIVTQYVLFFMSWPPFPPNTHNHLSMSLTSLKIAFPNTQPLHQPSFFFIQLQKLISISQYSTFSAMKHSILKKSLILVQFFQSHSSLTSINLVV